MRSPSCASYALRKTADDFGELFDEKVGKSIKTNFYVDEKDSLSGWLAISKRSAALEVSTSPSSAAPAEDSWDLSCPGERAKVVKSIDLNRDELPQERALGVCWRMDDDTFSFNTCADGPTGHKKRDSFYDQRCVRPSRYSCTIHSWWPDDPAESPSTGGRLG